MKASVVITTKNRREELMKAIESAMGQRGLLEVVVIDDGSTDDTATEVERIAAENGWLIAEGRVAPEDRPSEVGFAPSGINSESTGQALDGPRRSEIGDRGKGGAAGLDARRSALDSAPEAQALDAGCSPLDSIAAMPQLRLIRHEESRGLIVRRNEGTRVARGGVIFSLDDDAVFSSPFVVQQTLRDFSHPRIGAVAIPYIEPHKTNTEMQRAPTREDIWVTASYIGTAHAVRRDVFLALGGYREHLVHQGEEGDFCIRMLAADAAHVGDRRWKIEDREAAMPPMDDRGGRMVERRVAPEDRKSEIGDRGEGGVAALDSGRSTLDSGPLSAVPGFFVRLGNSDPIIHNESPKRDYSRMDFYGRRNDVLFHWQNTPMPDLLWQLPMTIAGGLLCAYRVKRWRKMLEGIGAGFLAIGCGVKREPVSKSIARDFKLLKQAKRKLSK
jgi:glycosyltransferase involved in cell wall biosynthesis